MSEDKLTRRERRHYRKYKDGEIVYDTPDSYSNSFSKANISDDHESKNLLDLTENNQEENYEDDEPIVDDKQKAIDKALSNLSEMINPDEEVIADIIYKGLKNKSIVGKDDIKSAVKNSKHYRATEKKPSSFGATSDRDRLKLVVEDVYTQIETQQKKKKQEKAKEKDVEDTKEKEKKEKEDKEKKDDKEEKSSKKKYGSKKEDKKPKKTKKKENNDDFKDLLDDSDEDLDLSDDEDPDDLGLKF